MQVEWRGLFFYATWVWLGNLVLIPVRLRGDVGFLKCGVKWLRVACIHQSSVWVFSFRGCRHGVRQSRIDSTIQLACKKVQDLYTKNGNFHSKLKVRDPNCKFLPVHCSLAKHDWAFRHISPFPRGSRLAARLVKRYRNPVILTFLLLTLAECTRQCSHYWFYGSPMGPNGRWFNPNMLALTLMRYQSSLHSN